MERLSAMQQKIYAYIVSCLQTQGYPPSVREIGDAVGLKSPSTVHFHLKKMEKAGVIERSAGKVRTISLAEGVGPPLEDERKTQEARENQVPILGDVAAGSPILAQECVEGYLAFETHGRGDEYFALRVRGESMLNAGILPGDLVVVHRQEDAASGEIVVALIDEEATVKRLSRRRGHMWLMPENDDYSPINGDRARILGRVSAVVRRY